MPNYIGSQDFGDIYCGKYRLLGGMKRQRKKKRENQFSIRKTISIDGQIDNA